MFSTMKLMQFTAENLVTLLRCKLSSNMTSSKETWKLFLIKVSGVLDEALKIFSNTVRKEHELICTSFTFSLQAIFQVYEKNYIFFTFFTFADVPHHQSINIPLPGHTWRNQNWWIHWCTAGRWRFHQQVVPWISKTILIICVWRVCALSQRPELQLWDLPPCVCKGIIHHVIALILHQKWRIMWTSCSVQFESARSGLHSTAQYSLSY